MTHSWKTWLWRTLVVAAIITVIAACFYAEENARGVRAWDKSEREITARGESLNWDDFIPAPVPDDQNFYQAPMMNEWFMKGWTNTTGLTLGRRLANPETTMNVITEISASNYLAWSAAFEPDFDKIRDALKRPRARLEGDYSRPFKQPIPNFVSYRIVTQTLAHRVKCHLLLGQPEAALADLTLLHKLNQTLVGPGKPATLVECMIHVAITALYADAVACGIDSRSWNETQLATLQKQFSEINLLPEIANTFRAERAGVCHMLDTSSLNELLAATGMKTNAISDLGCWFVPGGWVYQNKAVIATMEGSYIEAMDLTNLTVSPYKARASNERTEETFRRITPWNFIAAECIPNFSKAAENMARNQTWADQAQIVCALERYRLAQGGYPVALTNLVPQFLDKIPHDIINGKPMSYLRVDGQNFKLYSVGWNEADDGGITAHDSTGKEDRENGDWAWHYPAL